MDNIKIETKDQSYLKGILENDFQALEDIYKNYLPRITVMVTKNSGSTDEAKDVFQEAIVIIFKKVNDPNFNLNTSFYNYLYGVSRYVWLRELKKNKRREVTLGNEERYVSDEDIESCIIEGERKALFRQYFTQLGKECRIVLQQFFDRATMEEIASNMNYSVQYAKRKKYKCKEQLLKMIQKDSRFKELK